MNLSARQLTIDLYHCKNSKLQEMEAVQYQLRELLEAADCNIIDLRAQELAENNRVLIEGALSAVTYHLNRLGGTKVEPAYGSGGQEVVSHGRNFEYDA